MPYNRVFIHGLESSSQGTKGSFFTRRYAGMIVEDFPGTLEERMAKLERLLEGRDELILVGSSYGGLMAAIYACRHPGKVRKIILLAPALDLPDFDECLDSSLEIEAELFHGTRDDVVPPGPVREKAQRVFRKLNHHFVDDDHPLTDTFPGMDWDGLLEAGK